MGRIFVAGYPGSGGTGHLYMIDPAQAPGPVTEVAQTDAGLLAFDGGRIWATNGSEFKVDIITPGPTLPWSTTSVFIPPIGVNEPKGILFDGSNIWITGTGSLMKLDSNGKVLQTVALDPQVAPNIPVFDGANLWVPDSNGNSVIVVRTSDGAVLSTLTGNGLSTPLAAAFDGERVIVTTPTGVSVWRAADLTPIGFTPISGNPFLPCSDGISFWIPLSTANRLARF